MKFIYSFFIFVFSLSSFAQQEDPIRMLSFKHQKSLDTYMHKHHWHLVKKHSQDSIDGNYQLYKKKTFGHGNMYMAIHLNTFCHYQVFWADHHKYSPVLSYDDFLMVPSGKSRFNECIENKIYALKTVTFDDYHNEKNKNVFFGLIEHKEHHPNVEIAKGEVNIHTYAGVKEHHFNTTKKEIIKTVEQEKKVLEQEDKLEKSIDEKGKTLDLKIRKEEEVEK